MSLVHQENQIVIEYDQSEIIFGSLFVLILPIITIVVIELLSPHNEKLLLTLAVAGIFFVTGIYMLLTAYRRRTVIFDNKLTIESKYYVSKKIKKHNFKTSDIVSINYFEGKWSGDQPDYRSHIYLVFKNGNKVKIDSQRMYKIPFMKNDTSSLKSEVETIAHLIGVGLNTEVNEPDGNPI